MTSKFLFSSAVFASSIHIQFFLRMMVRFFYLVRNRQTSLAQEKKHPIQVSLFVFCSFSTFSWIISFFLLKFSSAFPFLVNSTVISMMNWPLLIQHDFANRKLIIDREWQNLILIIHLSSGRAPLFYCPMLFYSSNTHAYTYVYILS